MGARIFQHRQYEVIAKVIANEHANHDSEGVIHLALVDVTSALADAFEEDNPNFDRRRFVMVASGQPYDGLTANVVG